MEDVEDIKPCPFCGEKEYFHHSTTKVDRDSNIYWDICFGCTNCPLCVHFGAYLIKELSYEEATKIAIERWNKRQQT
jgi:Lar family restriction alleviation protein